MGPLVTAFERLAHDCPDREALWSRGELRRLSFRQLSERATAWEPYLRGDRRPIALALGNGSAIVELFVAARRLGIPVALMEPGSSAAERIALGRQLGLPRLIHRLGSKGGAATDRFPEWADPTAGPDSRSLADGIVETRLRLTRGIRLPPGTAVIKLTSGSTGRPVAACFTEQCLHVGVRQIGEGMGITARDRVVLAIPLSHSYGFDNGVLSAMVLGTPLVLEPSIFPGDLLRAVAEGEGTFLPLVPPLVRGLARGRWPELPHLRRVISAGGVLAPEHAEEFLRASGHPVHNFYGSTETGGITFETDPHDPASPGTVGKPLPGVAVELDEDGAVHVVSRANLIGRASVAEAGSPDPREQETAGAPRAVVTGDLARFTPDGRLRLIGRTADLLNVGGRKVAAVAVEEALRGLSGVADAAVVGVPDPMRGDRTVAFLVTDRWPIELGCLPGRLRPRELRRVERLPHNGRGKLDRAELRRSAVEPARFESRSGTE